MLQSLSYHILFELYPFFGILLKIQYRMINQPLNPSIHSPVIPAILNSSFPWV
ncbi:hypothetical protein Hanom_Chr02g00123401 [Helianthus anomalus]